MRMEGWLPLRRVRALRSLPLLCTHNDALSLTPYLHLARHSWPHGPNHRRQAGRLEPPNVGPIQERQ